MITRKKGRTTVEDDNDFMKCLPDFMSVDTEYLLRWIEERFNPEDVFPKERLEDWARSEGFEWPYAKGEL